MKASIEDISGPGPSNIVINEKVSMPAVNKETSVQFELSAPTLFTSCTSAPIKISKKYIGNVVKTEAFKKEKEKNMTMKALLPLKDLQKISSNPGFSALPIAVYSLTPQQI